MISFVITVIDPEDSSSVVTQDEDDDFDTTDITLNTKHRSRESAIFWDVDSERKHYHLPSTTCINTRTGENLTIYYLLV